MRVTNPTKNFYNNSTRRVLRVMSSKSSCYRRNMADAWHQRIYQEYLDCTAAGGKVIFATFSYHPSNLPRYYYVDRNGDKKSFPCFSKRDKDRFLDSLLKRFALRGVTGKTSRYPFKYVWANEYGVSTGCRHQPHYHCLFFVPPEILDIEGYDENHWKWLLRHYWTLPHSKTPLGWVMWTPGESIYVNSEFASMYVSKYMFKDDNLLLNDEVKEYVDIFGSLPDDGKKKGSLTNHWQSLHLGEGLTKVYDNVITYVEGMNFDLASEKRKGKVVRHKCPQYIANKILCDFDKDNKRYLLHQRGVEFRKAKFLRSFEKLCKRYKSYFDPQKLSAFIDDDLFKDSTKKISVFGNYQSFMKWLHNVNSCIFVRECVMYSLVWEGLLVGNNVVDDLMGLSHEDFISRSIEQYEKNIAPHLYFPVPNYSCEMGVFFNKENLPSELSFDDIDGIKTVVTDLDPVEVCNRFDNMPLFLDVVEEIDDYYSSRCESRYKEQLANRKYLKFKLSKSLNYG